MTAAPQVPETAMRAMREAGRRANKDAVLVILAVATLAAVGLAARWFA